MRYQRNEYDWCVMNNIMDKKQCTIIWYINDLKTSHVDPAVISRFIADIDAESWKIAKMTIMRGKVHKHLGMTIDYYSPGKLIFSMKGNILDDRLHWKNACQYSRKHEGGVSHTCCTQHLQNCRRCNQTIPIQCRPLPPLLITTSIYFKEVKSRHPDSSILHVN